jgi:hypothetical protein
VDKFVILKSNTFQSETAAMSPSMASVRTLLLHLLRLQAIQEVPAYVRWIDGLFPPGRKMGPMMDKVLWQGILKGTFDKDPAAAQQHYVDWNESVKQVRRGLYSLLFTFCETGDARLSKV